MKKLPLFEQSLEPEDFPSLIPWYWEGDYPIFFRGHKNKAELLVKSANKKTRRYDSIEQIHNIFINQHPNWAEFPKREHIMTNEYFTAKNYGNMVSVCVPIDPESKIGVCPDKDIWSSFKDRKGNQMSSSELSQLRFYGLESVIDLIEYVEEGPDHVKLADIESLMDKIDEEWEKVRAKAYSSTWTPMHYIASQGGIYKWLVEKVIKPDLFEILPFNKMTRNFLPNELEVWTDQDILMVEVELWNSVVNKKHRAGF